MKIIFGILASLFIIISFKDLKKESYYNILVKFGVLKQCFNPEENFKEIFQIENINYLKDDKKITQSSLEKLAEKNLKAVSSISKISHHIYFVQQNNTKPLLDFYVKKMAENFNKLNYLDKSWQHFLWTNNSNIFPDSVKNISGVVIKDLKEMQEHPLYNYLLQTINNGNENKAYFMEASDILRLMVLQKFGGMYNDIDYEIYNAISLNQLLNKFDFLGGREFDKEFSYYGNAFMAAKPNHPVINEALRRIEKFNVKQKNIPQYLKYPCNLYDKLYLNSPPLLTIAYFLKNNIAGNNDVIVPAWMLFNVNFARFKNGECDYRKLNQQGFAANNQKLDALISEYKKEHLNDKYSFFEIIGADMFCASWVDKKVKKNFYWRWNEH